MPAAPLPSNEQERLEALRSYVCLNGERDAWSDQIALSAAAVAGCPIGLISIVDNDEQWFKGRQGLAVDGTPRDVAFCAHAILSDEVFIIEDALEDERFATNPLVLDGPRIRFYAGVPLIDSRGFAIGTLCVIHTQPHSLSATQLDGLQALADLTLQHLSMSNRVMNAETQQSLLRDEVMKREAIESE
ncbi:MAG: GAF domain-containing protein, partial [Planctomycetota bacterium]